MHHFWYLIGPLLALSIRTAGTKYKAPQLKAVGNIRQSYKNIRKAEGSVRKPCKSMQKSIPKHWKSMPWILKFLLQKPPPRPPKPTKTKQKSKQTNKKTLLRSDPGPLEDLPL